MKKLFLIASLSLVTLCTFAQSPPARLKYFGFALVDCQVDDPNDGSTITNYITEVDTFSNVAQMYVANYTDTIINRVNLMNSLCVKPILSTSGIFIFLADTNGPSGSNYNLYPNYLARWNTFKTTNASVLNSNQIEVIYVCDEPRWNGLTSGEMDTICSLIKSDFPNIPLMFVEAYTEVDSTYVPTTVDWVGFDHYGIYDVSSDSSYLSWLKALEGRRSTPNQKIFLVFDDEWNSGFWPGGWLPDTMDHVVQHYYDLALADTNVIGMAGFTWPGLSPGWLGARSMPQNVIDKTVQLGQMIKANYNPCSTGIQYAVGSKQLAATIYPNPASDKLNFILPQNKETAQLKIYNSIGRLIKYISVLEELTTVEISDLSAGLYFYQISNKNGGVFETGKFIKE